MLLFLDPKERQSVVDVKLLPEAFFIGEKKKRKKRSLSGYSMIYRMSYGVPTTWSEIWCREARDVTT